MNGGFVSNAVCDTCTTVVPSEIGLKEKLEQALSESKLQEYKATEGNGQIDGTDIKKGDSLFVPANYGKYKITGDYEDDKKRNNCRN